MQRDVGRLAYTAAVSVERNNGGRGLHWSGPALDGRVKMKYGGADLGSRRAAASPTVPRSVGCNLTIDRFRSEEVGTKIVRKKTTLALVPLINAQRQ